MPVGEGWVAKVGHHLGFVDGESVLGEPTAHQIYKAAGQFSRSCRQEKNVNVSDQQGVRIA